MRASQPLFAFSCHFHGNIKFLSENFQIWGREESLLELAVTVRWFITMSHVHHYIKVLKRSSRNIRQLKLMQFQ